MHATNIDKSILDAMYKLSSIGLCSNTFGQAMVASILNPPVAGDASYELFERKKKNPICRREKILTQYILRFFRRAGGDSGGSEREGEDGRGCGCCVKYKYHNR